MIKKTISIMMLAVGVFSHSQALAATEPNRLELQQETTIESGTTEIVIPIQLENENTITGFQCDLYLPEGFSVAADNQGNYMIELGRTTNKRHNLSTRQLDNGSLRILCSSMTNATFTGNSGTVLDITLSVLDNIEVGNYLVNLKNIVLTDPQASRYTSSDVSENIIVKLPDPITIKANDLTMVYGDEVPELTYSTEGADLVGTPALSCSATSTSPVGTYPIIISKGTVENKRDTYVNGTLTITKAPLSIAADTYTKKQGEAMPEFTLTYTGFKNNETKDVLTKQPEVICNATEASAPGEYPVTVSGAEAQNYNISYTNGKLIVEDDDSPVLISSVTLDKTETDLIVGEIVQLNATISPDNATTKSVTWSSSKESIAVVNESGQVTAVSAGLCIITATANDGSGVSASCLVNVLGNVLYCEDLGAVPGATINLPILLTNADAIQGFEFKLVLPEGVSVETDGEGKLIATLTERVATQGLEGVKQSSNTYQFVFTSTNRLLGTSGAVVNIPLVVADNVAIGSYDVVIKDVELVKYGTSAQIHHGDRMAKLTIREMTLGDVNGDGRVSVADAISIINYVLGRTPVSFIMQAADVNGDGSISLGDAVATVDIILGGSNNSRTIDIPEMLDPQ